MQKKILIVEDDKFLLRVYGAKFNKDDVNVTLLEDGSEVTKTAKELHPDLILLDLILPKKDGFKVLEELKSDPSTKKIPVIVITQLSQDEDIAKAKALGIVKYLVKSESSLKEIKTVLDEYLS
ncbi:hypothetical protein A2W32_02815 [candidate division WWE3 bacterium RBG_16_37_10]|uniref:Response regulatory domain-containing protein n=1 Tax=candidate division WWE3 bacterium RBG_16_37_10 TaxID=1802610 RepID=A0A1F4V3G1_UNCKA|nr:MAG: hypothetical protein A2W32_02815 [candidate division WWE3 bacterium RBG_16_37_10]